MQTVICPQSDTSCKTYADRLWRNGKRCHQENEWDSKAWSDKGQEIIWVIVISSATDDLKIAK